MWIQTFAKEGVQWHALLENIIAMLRSVAFYRFRGAFIIAYNQQPKKSILHVLLLSNIVVLLNSALKNL